MNYQHVLVDPESSGMASMLGDLLEENIADSKIRRRLLAIGKGGVVITAADKGVSVLLLFERDKVRIVDLDTDACVSGHQFCELSGPWLDMADLCSGQLSVFRAIYNGKLKIRRLKYVHKEDILALVAASVLLKVPSSFYGEKQKWPYVVVTVVGVAGLVALLIHFRKRCFSTTGVSL
ncbi:MAG: hypothetical protein M1483_01715 [Actinobacteria bacterium]|nr:hypothetical protein [Actinomycetota bacterium]MCL6104347.1 hypothetical protein [Actinomycetota bacterium]